MKMHAGDRANQSRKKDQPFLEKICVSFFRENEEKLMRIECVVPNDFQKGALKYFIPCDSKKTQVSCVHAAHRLSGHSPDFLLEASLRDATLSISIEQKPRIILHDCVLHFRCTPTKDSFIYLAGESLDEGVFHQCEAKHQAAPDNEELQGYGFLHYRESFDAFLLGSLDNDAALPFITFNYARGSIVAQQKLQDYKRPVRSPIVMNWALARGSLEQCYRWYFSHLRVAAEPFFPCVGFSRTCNKGIPFKAASFSNEINTIVDALDDVGENMRQDALFASEANVSKEPRGLDVLLTRMHVVYNFEPGLCRIGDWEALGNVFRRPEMEACLKVLKENKILLGITYAPLLCEEDSDLFFNYQDWCVRDEKGSLLSIQYAAKRCYILDIKNVEVRSYILQTLDSLTRTFGVRFIHMTGLQYAACSARSDQMKTSLILDVCSLLKKGLRKDSTVIASDLPLAYHAILSSGAHTCYPRYELRDVSLGAHAHRENVPFLENNMRVNQDAFLEQQKVLDYAAKYFCGIEGALIHDEKKDKVRYFFLKRKSTADESQIKYRPAQSFFYDIDYALSGKICLSKELARVIAYMNV